MNFRLFALSLLALTLPAATASAQPTYKFPAPADFKAPKADLEKWANRLKALCPEKGWAVSVENNDVLIERGERVRFYTTALDLYIPPVYVDKTYRLRLRFAPLLGLKQYEKLADKNQLVEVENNRLIDKYNQKTVYYGPSLGGVLNRQSYLKESKPLVFNRLPDFYTPDYSVTVFQSWDRNSQPVNVNQVNVADECDDVRKLLPRTFGVYDPDVAAGKRAFGIEESLVLAGECSKVAPIRRYESLYPYPTSGIGSNAE